ncbi:pyridoxamine 5'-phosphate oxidase family protein [Acinetobacter sp. c1-l78]|uniref:pyridoxamine 5'-phosphate oxidase family protein n=1 Tax=Acinetobacter sp. c1-l78 TaxID=3342803 RepID=UPI0035B8A2DF
MQNHIETTTAIMKDVKFAMMTTMTSEGHLHACPMTTTEFDLANKEIWFIGYKTTETVQDISRNPQVNLSYASSDSKDYVSINGKAELVEDRAKLEALWSATYNAFFENGIDDANVQLIKIVPNGVQYWQSGNSVVNIFKMTAAAVTGGKVADSLGENSSFKL